MNSLVSFFRVGTCPWSFLRGQAFCLVRKWEMSGHDGQCRQDTSLISVLETISE
jgi:hypothetical protein